MPQQKDGSPSWPAGVVGSISHGRRTAWAVVGSAALFAGIGVDVEELGPDPSGDREPPRDLLHAIAGPDERRALGVATIPRSELFLKVLTIKESVFKCFSRQVGGWGDFTEVSICSLPVRSGEFVVQLPMQVQRATGVRRWGGILHCGADSVAAATVLPARTTASKASA